jgi:carbon starvation protein
MVVSFALTTLDSATRLLRYNIEEIGQTVRWAPLSNRFLSTSIAVLAIAFFAFFKIDGQAAGLVLWQLFGSVNQLLAGLALLVVSLYLIQRGRRSLPFLIPMVFMMVSTLTAMVLKVRDFYQQREYLLLGLSLAIIVIAVWLIIEAVLAIGRQRRLDPLTTLEIDLPEA